MLTIKAPIQLHISQGLQGNYDAFGQRIRGNYGMIGAHYTPKDLLFLLIAPPELPEDLGGMTTLVNQQNTVDVRSVTMDVVNNVVNRIMLDGTSQFTYQDQVYITSVLNKLGVTNVAQFMEQIRQLRSENENTVQLTRVYRAELERVLREQGRGEKESPHPIVPRQDGTELVPARDPKVELSMEVFKRLDTTNLFETVHKFQRNWRMGDSYFDNREFRVAEHMRVSNALSLAEIKQQIFEQPRINLLHHVNQYETGVLLQAPENEEAVLSQAATAALVTAVDNTVTQVLNRPSLKQEQWLNISHAISQTAENTVSRFESYHSQYQLAARTQQEVQEAAHAYTRELQEYRSFYQKIYPRAEEFGRSVGLPDVTVRQLMQLTKVEQKGDEIRQMFGGEIRLTQEQRQSLLQQLIAPTQVHTEHFETQLDRERGIRQEHSSESELLRQQEIREQIFRQARAGEAPVVPDDRISAQDGGGELPGMPPLKLTDREGSEELPDVVIEQLEEYDIQNRAMIQSVREELLEREVHLPGKLLPGERLRPEMKGAGKGISLQLTDREREEQLPDVLVEQIEQIEAHNRTLMQNIRQEGAREMHTILQNQLLQQLRSEQVRQAEESQVPGREIEYRSETTYLLHGQPERGEVYERTLLENVQQEGTHEVRSTVEQQILQRMQAGQPEREENVPLQLTDREREEPLHDVLVEQIEQLDEHNRMLLQSIRQEGTREVHTTLQQQLLQQLRSEQMTVEDVKSLNLTNIERKEENNDVLLEQIEQGDIRTSTLTQNIHQQIGTSETASEPRTPEGVTGSGGVREDEAQTRSVSEIAAAGEILQRLRSDRTGPTEQIPMRPMQLTDREREEPLPDVLVEQIEQLDQHNRTLIQNIHQQIRKGETAPDARPREQMPGSGEARDGEEPVRTVTGAAAVGDVLQRLRSDRAERTGESPARSVQLTDREQELLPDVLVEQVEQIDQHNRTLMQTIRQEGAREVHTTLQQFRQQGGASEAAPYAGGDLPAMTLTAWEAEEQAPDILIEQLNRIDQHNRTLMQSIREEKQQREVRLPGPPDMKRTMREALRALEEPEQLLRDVYHEEQTTMVHPVFTEDEQAILDRVDPVSRPVYEQILAYQKDPEGTLAKGLLRPANMGVLQAELRQAMGETSVEMEHPKAAVPEQTTLVREQSEVILEQLRRMPGQRVREEVPAPPAAVRIIHKQAPPDVTEELLERLEEQRLSSTVTAVTEQQVTNRSLHQTDVTQIDHKVVAQTTEDITQLVNKTLARQMRTISDQVYRQMEKRLQAERSRRGRF